MSTETTESCINKICQLNAEVGAKGIKLINKIFGNLINNPNEEKYKNLNFEKISQKLQSSQLFIDLLLIAGFVISPNQQRLYFDDDKINDLFDTNKLLQSKLNKVNSDNIVNVNSVEQKIEEKNEQSNNDIIDEKAEQKYSNDENETKDALSNSNVVSYLMNMGYDETEVKDALTAANNDAIIALEILLHGTILEHTFVDSTATTRSHLKDLWSINEKDRMEGMKVFYKICSKLLENLDNIKYHNLNYEEICNKFNKCFPCVDLLQDAGFIKSEDGKRLVFDEMYMKNLSNVMQQMNDML